MPNTQLHYMTISELGRLLKSRKISAVEVTETMLGRIDALDHSYKGYATVMPDHAMRAARLADDEIRRGNYIGPLHGVPIAVKDLCFTNGVRTMGGCKVMENHIPVFDATVVSRLASAGGVILGKLNLTEGAMGGYNPSFDVPLNPWNT